MEFQADKGEVEATGNTLSTRDNNNLLPHATRPAIGNRAQWIRRRAPNGSTILGHSRQVGAVAYAIFRRHETRPAEPRLALVE
jgi:hypothetical protein